MLKTLIRIMLPIVYFLGFVTACSPKKQLDKEIAFAKLVSIKGINEKLKLKPLKTRGPIILGNDFDILIENISKDAIWFPEDLGLKLLQYDRKNGAWIEVRNKVRYLDSQFERIIEPIGKETPNYNVEVVWPDLLNGKEVITIRIMVLGKVYRDGKLTDEDVGGWVDVTLPP